MYICTIYIQVNKCSYNVYVYLFFIMFTLDVSFETREGWSKKGIDSSFTNQLIFNRVLTMDRRGTVKRFFHGYG